MFLWIAARQIEQVALRQVCILQGGEEEDLAKSAQRIDIGAIGEVESCIAGDSNAGKTRLIIPINPIIPIIPIIPINPIKKTSKQ